MSFTAWHFLPGNGMTANKNPVRVEVGQTLRVPTPITLCGHPCLHWSRRPIDALKYAPGSIVQLVRPGGDIIEENDKGGSSERTCLAIADATQTLREFARWCALQVAHLWNTPDIVRQYLETGDESIRDAAWDASTAARDASTAARDASTAARDASTAARDARHAALAAAGASARAARDASDAAWVAAWASARDAARDAQNTKLEAMLRNLLGGEIE